MKKFLPFMFLFSVGAIAQTAVLPVYDCVNNGTQALTSGMKSTNYMQGVVPYCTVTVYLTGTQIIATTSPQTPFIANSNGSITPIYATIGTGYDVVFSNSSLTVCPNCYTNPVTLTDVYIIATGVTVPVPINEGGTGAVTAPAALANLGAAALSGAAFTGPVYVNSYFEVGPSSIATSGVVGITQPVNATTFPGLGPGFAFHSLSTSGLIFNADGFSGCYPTDNDACAYADFDAEAQLNGATNFNHYVSGQFRGIYNGTGGISSGSTPRWDGIDIALVATATSVGAIPTIAGIHIFPPNIMAGSAVTLGSVYGLQIDNMQTVIPFGGASTAILTGTGLVQFGDSTYMPRLLQGFSGTAPDLVDVYALLTNTGIGMTVYPPNVLDVDMQSGNMIALHPSSNNTADYTDIKATFSSSTSVSNTLSFNIATVTAGTTSNSLTLRGDGSVLLGNSNLMLVNGTGYFYVPGGAFATTSLGTDAVDIGTSAASSSFPQLVFRGWNSGVGDPRIVIVTNGSSDIGIGDDSTGGINLGFTAGPASGWGTIGMNIAITSGDVTMGTIKWFHAAPTITSGFGTGAAINSSDGPTSFTMSTGSGSWGSSGVIGLPSAANDWSCTCTISNNAVNSTINRCMQTNDSTTSATITNFNSSGTATAWNANVYLLLSCFPH
jgi:hypothetical protein